MLRHLELHGFKSFVADDLEFGNLTILTGLNSSGKSSVIQALQLVEKAYKGLDIYLDGHGGINESQNPFTSDGIHITCKLSNSEVIELENDKILMNSLSAFPELIHITADRFGPETSVAVNNKNGKLGKRGENIFLCIDMNADKPLPEILKHPNSEGDTFLFNLKAWLSIISPNVNFESFILAKSDSSYGTFNSYRAKNVGFGLSYSLPIITALLLGSITPNSVVILENPEAHLHPRGQTEMARLIALCVKSGVQVIIETHSDHLFDGIRLFAKNSGDEAFVKGVSVYWFELDKDRNTQIETMHMDENGRIDNWPKGMFDQFSINAIKLL